MFPEKLKEIKDFLLFFSNDYIKFLMFGFVDLIDFYEGYSFYSLEWWELKCFPW